MEEGGGLPSTVSCGDRDASDEVADRIWNQSAQFRESGDRDVRENVRSKRNDGSTELGWRMLEKRLDINATPPWKPFL